MGHVVAGTSGYDAMPVVGSCDRSSVAAGETVTFHVSVRGTSTYFAELVRLFNGDTNPSDRAFRGRSLMRGSRVSIRQLSRKRMSVRTRFCRITWPLAVAAG